MSNKLDDIIEKLNSAKLPDVDFEAYYKAQDEDTLKIKRVVDYSDELEDFLDNGDKHNGSKLPFAGTHKLFRFRTGEVTLWTGYNGHKKSMMLGFCALDFLREQQKVCIASFEMKPIKTIIRMARQQTHSTEATYDCVADFMQFAANNLYIFDHMGNMSADRLYAIIYYSAKELGVKHFVIDSLMRVIAGEDNYNDQKDFTVKLCNLAIKLNIHIHLVHHTKKGKEGEPSNRYDAKGSGAISDNVSNSLIVWSNKEKKADMPDVILKCDKQRDGEWEGSVPIKFEESTMRFYQMFSEDS